jgi:sugar/nucleoside kinase (ribokinase family)
VGHVTIDVMAPDGPRRPGGGALYSALQAARLGLRTLIVTRGAPRELDELLEPYRDELEVEVLPAERTTTLLTWGKGDSPRQRLLAWAGPIDVPVAVDTSILHLAPIARETPRAWQRRASFVGLTPQGLVREWDADGGISLAPLRRELLPERCDAAVFSETERARCEELISRACAGEDRPGSPADPVDRARDPADHPQSPLGPIVAVTAGARAVTLHLPDRAPLDVAVPPIDDPRDDLGAGDVFAAAFFVALHRGLPPADAAAYGNAAAAVRIAAGAGPGAVGDRDAIQARLAAVGSRAQGLP